MVAVPDFYENAYARFWLSDGLLYFTYKDGVTIDLSAAKLLVSDRIRFQDERSFAVVCDVRGIVAMDKEARDYLAKTGSILTLAVALVGAHTVSLSMSTFYIKVSQPAVPTALFDTEAEAVVYLKALR